MIPILVLQEDYVSTGRDDTMRILDTVTGGFVHIDPHPKNGRSKPFKYAVLSHTWGHSGHGEQSYKQLRAIQKHRAPFDDDDDDEGNEPFVQDPLPDPTPGAPPCPFWSNPKLSPKILNACRVALENGYRYLWIDFCCIDKTNSSELSESINSMYEWYALADVCYAFLVDVPFGVKADLKAKDSCFRSSRWFKRGWTLQELIAPFNVVFLAMDWTAIGSKFILADLIVEITNIHYDALLHLEPLEAFSVAQRLSWGSRRETTKVEDRAYSLLGILNINMSTLYGEGERAFQRLQEEIMRHTPDQSLLAWTAYGMPRSSFNTLPYNPQTTDTAKYEKEPLVLDDDDSRQRSSFLAPSLDAFSECDRVQTLSHDEVLLRLGLTADALPPRHYDFTPYGLRVLLPVIHLESSNYFRPDLLSTRTDCPPCSQWYLVIIGCEHRDFPGSLLGRVCYIQSLEENIDLLYSGYINHDGGTQSDLLPVSPDTIARLHQRARGDSPAPISPKLLYIPQPPGRDKGVSVNPRDERHETIHLVLPKKNQDALFAQGYTATLVPDGPDDAPTAHSVTLTNPKRTITIDYRHTLSVDMSGSQSSTIRAHVTTSTEARRPDGQGSCQWTDIGPPWSGSLGLRDIVLKTPKGSTLSLGLAFFKTNYYLLSIQFKTHNLPPNRAMPVENSGDRISHILPKSASASGSSTPWY